MEAKQERRIRGRRVVIRKSWKDGEYGWETKEGRLKHGKSAGFKSRREAARDAERTLEKGDRKAR